MKLVFDDLMSDKWQCSFYKFRRTNYEFLRPDYIWWTCSGTTNWSGIIHNHNHPIKLLYRFEILLCFFVCPFCPFLVAVSSFILFKLHFALKFRILNCLQELPTIECHLGYVMFLSALLFSQSMEMQILSDIIRFQNYCNL